MSNWRIMAGMTNGPLTAFQKQPCDHYWISEHQPGHLLYWVRVCGICHEPDWDDLDREIAKLLKEKGRNENMANTMDPFTINNALLTSETHQTIARKLVYNHVISRLEKTDRHVTFKPDEVYVVISAYILGNWKCLVSTTLPDGMYYEVTFDVDEERAYIDAYKKFENVQVDFPRNSDAPGS